MNPIFSALVQPISGLLDKVIPDKDQRDKLAHEIATMTERQTHSEVMAQIAVNKQEAAHKSLFVAGWRPAVGWTCVLALLNNYIVIPYMPEAQAMSLVELLPILGGMLGLSLNRTKEKIAGVAREK